MIKQLIEKIKGLFAKPTPAAPVEFIEPTLQMPAVNSQITDSVTQAAPQVQAPDVNPQITDSVTQAAPAPVEKKPKAPRKQKPAAKKPVAK